MSEPISPPSSAFRMAPASGERMAGSVPVWERPSLGGSTKVPSPSAGDKPFSFLDLLDVINPLQHIPIIGTIYRALTGDEIKPAARIIGDTAFGGAVGAAIALADTALEASTGKDAGQHVVALFDSGSSVRDQLPGTTIALADLRHPQFSYNS